MMHARTRSYASIRNAAQSRHDVMSRHPFSNEIVALARYLSRRDRLVYIYTIVYKYSRIYFELSPFLYQEILIITCYLKTTCTFHLLIGEYLINTKYITFAFYFCFVLNFEKKKKEIFYFPIVFPLLI